MKGGEVTRDSLKDKVVVLDMWATWCGWCFRGFPNLQKVYDGFKDNDKVVILAVNTDDPRVTDAEVRKSFADAQVSLPIVRDEKQMSDKIFQVQGLPTMVILGTDGTVQDYHIGYDEKLSETLPKKLDALLAGQSITQEQLDKYAEEQKKFEAAQKEYDKMLADAAVGPSTDDKQDDSKQDSEPSTDGSPSAEKPDDAKPDDAPPSETPPSAAERREVVRRVAGTRGSLMARCSIAGSPTLTLVSP